MQGILHLEKAEGEGSAHAERLIPKGSLARDWSTSTFAVHAGAGCARNVRHRIMDLARSLPFSSAELDSIEIAVGEAALNAARHGSPNGADDLLRVHCERNAGQFIIEITDQGEGFSPLAVSEPVAENMNCSGYGICLMKNLMDDLRFVSTEEGGTTVRMMKRYAVVD
jgi:serine/threonine-protein kinase RsbW